MIQIGNLAGFYIPTTLGAIPPIGIYAIEISAYVQQSIYKTIVIIAPNWKPPKCL